MLLPGLAVICAYPVHGSDSLSFLTEPLNKHSVNPVWAVNFSSWRAQRNHCIAGGGFYAVIAGQGREFEVNARGERKKKADARPERRRDTKAGKFLPFFIMHWTP